MSRRILAIAAAAGALATAGLPAFAGSLSEPAPEPVVEQPAPVEAAPRAMDWSGPYVGGQIGWGDVDAGNVDGDGVIGGVNAGYRRDFGGFVLGGEAQYDVSDIELGDDAATLDDVGRLKATAGYALGRTLVYGTAGWARASVDGDGIDGSDDGWVAGVGVDHMVTDRVALGGEVLYHEFDDFDGSGTDVDATTLGARMTFNF